MFDQEDLKTATLSVLGAMLLDAIDEGVANGEPVEVENACVQIGNEILYRVPDAEKLRHLMDFHYKKWADMMARSDIPNENTNDSYLELRAMMAGYVQCHHPAELEIEDEEFLRRLTDPDLS